MADTKTNETRNREVNSLYCVLVIIMCYVCYYYVLFYYVSSVSLKYNNGGGTVL